MNCHRCGAQLSDGSLFCTQCGAQFPRSVVQPDNMQNQSTAPKDNDSDLQESKKIKKKKGLIIVSAVLALVIIAAVAIFASWFLSPEQKVIRALNAGDYELAADIMDENTSLRRDGDIENIASNRIEQLRQDYLDRKISYSALLKAISNLKKMNIKAVNGELEGMSTFALLIEQSRGYFESGDALYENGEYLSAIESYQLVFEEDPDFAKAQDMIQKCTDEYRKDRLDAAAAEAAEGKYDDAIRILEDALKNIPDDQILQEQIEKYRTQMGNQERADALAEAEKYANDGEYESAIARLERYLRANPGDVEVQEKLEAYETALSDQKRNEVLQEAEDWNVRGDTERALDILNDYIERNGSHPDVTAAYDTYKAQYVADVLANVNQADSAQLALQLIIDAQTRVEDVRLDNKRQEYEQAYVEEVLAETDRLVADAKHDDATRVITSALRLLPDNEALKTKLEEVQGAKPVLLNSLAPINGSFAWNEGTPEDPFGNSYSDVQNYAIFHASRSYHDREQTYFIEYKVDEQYNCLNFVISPYSDFGENASSYLQVFVNGSLRYTSPKIYQKTEPLQVPGIDVSDATYVKIVVYVGGHGCVMLSDVTLSNPVGFTSQLDGSLISLAVMDTFNGSLPWYNEFPADARNNDYFHCSNYAVLHSARSYHDRAQTYSAEYYLAKGYSYLALDIAPATDFGEAGSTVVKIYVNDELRYTSPAITQKTTKFGTGKIDLTGADYVKIVIEVQGHSCTIVSNAVLKKNEQL